MDPICVDQSVSILYLYMHVVFRVAGRVVFVCGGGQMVWKEVVMFSRTAWDVSSTVCTSYT